MSESTQDRFDRRLIAWGLELVPAEEARELEAWWTQLQHDLGAPEPKDAVERHVPARMLAQWPRVERELQGLERELVNRHLTRCDACRADLVLVQQLPREQARPRVVVRRPARLAPWLGGGAIGAVAASLAFLLLRPQGDLTSSLPQSEGPLAWVAPSFARGTTLSEVQASPGQPFVLVVTVPMEFAPDEVIQVSVRDPNAVEIARFTLRQDQLVAGSALLQLQPARPDGSWQPGTYAVSLHAGDQSELGEFVLRPNSVATKPAQK